MKRRQDAVGRWKRRQYAVGIWAKFAHNPIVAKPVQFKCRRWSCRPRQGRDLRKLSRWHAIERVLVERKNVFVSALCSKARECRTLTCGIAREFCFSQVEYSKGTHLVWKTDQSIFVIDLSSTQHFSTFRFLDLIFQSYSWITSSFLVARWRCTTIGESRSFGKGVQISNVGCNQMDFEGVRSIHDSWTLLQLNAQVEGISVFSRSENKET